MALTEPYEPVELSPADKAFPAHALDWMPEPDDIPKEYWHTSHYNQPWYAELWSDIFFKGLKAIELVPEDESWAQGDIDRAFNHLLGIVGSYAPKHEHKEAALAFLTDRWFKAARWKLPKSDEWKSTPDVEWP